MTNKLLDNRTSIQISKLEFAAINDGHYIVRITCSGARPKTSSVRMYLIKGDASRGKSELRAIQQAVMDLREDYPSTKIMLDPDAGLQPLAPLGKWSSSWQEQFLRAHLGLTWAKDFSVPASALEEQWMMDDDERAWVNSHCRVAEPESTKTSTKAQNGIEKRGIEAAI